MEPFQQLLLYLAGPAIIGQTCWIWALWSSHNNLRLNVAENYIKKDELASVQRELRTLTGLMYKIAGRLGVPVADDNREGI
jgi:hypothetical protein